MSAPASAGTLTFVPNDADLQDLDHHNIYTWVITSVGAKIPTGQQVTGAYLFFDNIRNWDSSSNRLFMHLLDTAITNPNYDLTGSQVSPGSAAFVPGTSVLQNPTGAGYNGGVQVSYTATDDTSATPTGLVDNFAATATNQYLASTTGAGAQGQGVLVSNGTGNTPLFNAALPGNSGSQVVGTGANAMTESWARGALGDATHSFSVNPEDYRYDFTSAQITKLNAYIASGGDFAIALDPDCHFFNDGVYMVLTTGTGPGNQSVPEPASLTLLGLGLAGVYSWRRKQAVKVQAL